MLSYRIKTPAYYKAKTSRERLYFLSGIPEKFWNVTEKQIQFSSFSTTNDDKSVVKITQKSQQEYFDKLNLNSKDIVCIASNPTDTMALAVASIVAKKAVHKEIICEMVDLGTPLWLDKVPNILIIHNIMEESTWDRFQFARDWLTRFDGSLKIVVAATANPVAFVRKLRKDVDQILFSNQKFVTKILNT